MTPSEKKPMKEQHGLISQQQGNGDDFQRQGSPHFGNYDLVRRIDVGGMGEVYLARQRTAFGREVAVKIIRSDLMHDVTARKRFLREAEVSAHLKHEHILPLFEFGEEQGRLFLVTPYIENGTLARLLQRGPIPLAEVHQLFTALVQAVAYIHKRGVVHRDLKPSNILLDQEGDGQTYVRLIDFGIASIQGTAASAPLTSAGHEMGTVAYMAPERLSGIAAPSNDIYSLGIILYQMLTGQLPNTGKAVALPQVLDLIIQRSTAPDPNQRYATADEVLKAFEYAYRFLNSNAAQKANTGLIKPVTVDEQFMPDEPTPRRLPGTRPAPLTNEFAESMILRRNEGVAPSRTTTAFKGEDYNAPTAMIEPELVATATKNTGATSAVRVGNATGPQRAPRKQTRRRVSLLVGLSISTILVILALVGFSALAFQASISATVTVTPQAHTISTIMNVTARIGQKNIDAANSIIPAAVLSSVQTTQRSGVTTGQGHCGVFGIFDCKQVVSQDDVDALTAQTLPTLKTQLAQDLQRQVQTKGVTQVGTFHYADPNSTANPAVGSESKTVTVSVSEQGFVEYINTSDVTSLARQLLDRKKTQQYGPKYTLLNQFTQIGQPVVQSVDAQGTVTIQIAVGGVVKYQLTASDLSTLQSRIKGLKLQAAKGFLSNQHGIAPTGVNIHISYGDTVPTNLGQIHVSAVDPTNFPPVQLPTVKAQATTTTP